MIARKEVRVLLNRPVRDLRKMQPIFVAPIFAVFTMRKH